MKTKVFIIIDSLGPGGTQRQLVEYLKYADKSTFDISVISLDKNYDTLANEIRQLECRIIGFDHKGFFNLSTLTGLVKLFKKERPDIAHTHLFTSDLYGRLAAKLAGVPVIVNSVHGFDLWQKWHHILVDRILAKFTDIITVNAEVLRSHLTEKKKITAGKIITIFNGIDLRRFGNLRPSAEIKKELNIPEDALVVGMVSRFDEPKDYGTFFEAAELVLKQNTNVYFVAVGEGPQRAKFYSILNTQYSIPIMSHFIFTALRRDIPDLINAMDVCVLSSKHEGCPNVILEYMACSKPVIASNVGGCPELVGDGKIGSLVPVGDPVSLARTMVNLLNDNELRQRMGAEGRKVIEEKFTAQKMASRLEGLYNSLTQSKIAYVLSQFPETHETFILRELRALEAKGVNFKIFSLKPCRDKVIHPEARELMKHTIYIRIYFLSSIFYLLAHPLRTISSLFYVFATYATAPIGESAKALYVWLVCLGLAGLMRSERIMHIHCHWATMPATAGMILNKLTGISFSFTAHAWDIFISQRGLREKIENAKFVVTCTEYNRKYLTSLTTSNTKLNTQYSILNTKIYLNYHGLDLDNFKPREDGEWKIENGKIRLLAIGRLVEQKGFEYLVEACGILRDRSINFKCTIIGNGPLQRHLSSIIHSLSLQEQVILVGMKTQEEIKQLYRESDIFVAPSVVAKNGDRDGIPNVIIEALAIGVPVVATSVSGIPEAVIDNKTGILVPPKNSAVLADAIGYLWKNPGLREKFAVNGRKLIEQNFSTDKNIEELIGIFRANGVLHDTKPYTLIPTPSTNRINILYVIWSLGLGGAERVVINLAKGLDRSRFNPVVCCLNDKGPFAKELEDVGIKVFALNKRGKFDFSILHSLSSIFKQFDVHVVHTHLWGANFWGRIAARKAKVKVVIATEHNEDVWKNTLHFITDKILSYRTDRIIAVSTGVKKFYIKRAGIRSDKIRVIHNGIASMPAAPCNDVITQYAIRKKEFGIQDDETVLAIIGRLVPQKGHKYLFDVVKSFNGSHKIKVLVIGDGPLRESLQLSAISHQLKDKVIFTGLRKDVPELLKGIDILVMPSLREGLPIVALEAMAKAKPIIATNVGGNPEVILDGQTGFLVQPEDRSTLAKAIETLVRDKELAKKFGNNGYDRVKEFFSIEKMIRETENLYEGCLKEKESR